MPRVLIVDDEENQRRALSIGLRLEGFDVVVAGSSQEALRALGAAATVGEPSRGSPNPSGRDANPSGRDVGRSHGSGIDLALIDLMMPGLNGLELARQIRRLFPAVRVVLSSAYHLSVRQVERADCGAIGFVPKPYRLTELCSFLRAKTKTVSPSAC